MGLGGVLYALGNSESGTARLEEAAAAFRLALEVMTRDGMAMQWAMTNISLALTLEAIAQRGDARERYLSEALDHLSQARSGLAEAGESHWLAMTEGELERMRQALRRGVASRGRFPGDQIARPGGF
jgi:hypothetical protein